VITAQRLEGRAGALHLASFDGGFGPGLHAVVGRVQDGRSLLLALLAGLASPSHGQVWVLGADACDPDVRRHVGIVPLEAPWPTGLSVADAFRLADSVRGAAGPPWRERLRSVGLEALALRRGESLTPAEQRALAFCEAITAPQVRVLLLDEPFYLLPPELCGGVARTLRLWVSGDAPEPRVALVGTASVRDATDLADDLTFLQGGRVVARTLATDAMAVATPARLFVATTEGDRLAAALAAESDVSVQPEAAGVRLAGATLPLLAAALARAVVAAGVPVDEVRPS
jgi:ABC-type multidrug transport system ATPase subunit